MITGTAKTALRHGALLVLGIAAISPAAYADGTISACPTTVTGPGTWTVTQNLTATGTCITIQGNGVAIDLQGHTITALGTGADFGITDAGSCASPPCQQNIIIANGTITGFFIGIGLENTDYATIANMTVIGSRPWGIRLRAHSVITDSQANQGVGGKDAMLFLGDHNTVNNSKANDNLGTGIAFAGNDNTVNNSKANGNAGAGIFSNGTVTVSNSLANNNGVVGMAFNQSATVSNSQANNTKCLVTEIPFPCGDGMQFRTGGGTVNNSQANGNAGGGMDFLGVGSGIDFLGGGNTVNNSQANGNKANGISIDGSGNVLAGNTANGNSVVGISVACPSNVFDNTAKGNPGGNIVTSGTDCVRLGNNPAP